MKKLTGQRNAGFLGERILIVIEPVKKNNFCHGSVCNCLHLLKGPVLKKCGEDLLFRCVAKTSLKKIDETCCKELLYKEMCCKRLGLMCWLDVLKGHVAI